jgi:hypothetical protein
MKFERILLLALFVPLGGNHGETQSEDHELDGETHAFYFI